MYLCQGRNRTHVYMCTRECISLLYGQMGPEREEAQAQDSLHGGSSSVVGVRSERSIHTAWCEDSSEKREACRIGEPCCGDNMAYVLFGEAV